VIRLYNYFTYFIGILKVRPTLKCVSNIYYIYFFSLISKNITLHKNQIDLYPFFSEAAHNIESFFKPLNLNSMTSVR
jgi:hypothetical protein